MLRLCLLIIAGPLALVLLLVVMVMAAYLAARLTYIEIGNVVCFEINNSTHQYVYAQAVTAAVFSGVSFLCVLVLMGIGLSNTDDKDETERTTTEQPMTAVQ
jgi:hypothetical protein